VCEQYHTVDCCEQQWQKRCVEVALRHLFKRRLPSLPTRAHPATQRGQRWVLGPPPSRSNGGTASCSPSADRVSCTRAQPLTVAGRWAELPDELVEKVLEAAGWSKPQEGGSGGSLRPPPWCGWCALGVRRHHARLVLRRVRGCGENLWWHSYSGARHRALRAC
jgi:hypothetical protein